ncbi:SDR family oxidoreductase [Pseudogracilibacillus sp. SO30301A]|uniref:SDR family oxidoreductase n=1 Tax=Pseudogracilibacillus sp. SO30301A TaxID=3098291 RepID=UPI00300DF234
MENEQVFIADLFKGKRALITGGGTGIGFAIAELLGSLGAHVIIAARTVEKLENATQQLREKNIKVDYLPVNIRDETEVEELFKKIFSKWETLDFLINNAGGQFAAPAKEISHGGFRAVVDLNLQGTWHMSSTFAKKLIVKGSEGRIINIVLCLKSGMPGMVHAAAARAGVMNMTKTLAYEWGSQGITVNTIAPGTIQTDGLEQYDEKHLQKSIEELPINRMGTANEVAHAVAYLLSPAGSYFTGTTLEIDGGEHLLGARSQL